MKPGVFPDIPFPSPEFSQNPFKSVSVPVCTKEFSQLNFFSSREFFQDFYLVCVPVSSPEFSRIFPDFPGFSPSNQTGSFTRALPLS
jgi:hypothetical protein